MSGGTPITRDEPPRDAVPGDAALGDAAPGDAAPGDAALGDAAPSDAASGDATPGDEAPGDAASGDGIPAADAACSCRTSLARNAGPSTMRLATTASAATDDAAAHRDKVRRPTIPTQANRAIATRAKRCGQERTALKATTKVLDPVFVVLFNMLSWAVRPLHGLPRECLAAGVGSRAQGANCEFNPSH
jgi:hypothetical protein